MASEEEEIMQKIHRLSGPSISCNPEALAGCVLRNLLITTPGRIDRRKLKERASLPQPGLETPDPVHSERSSPHDGNACSDGRGAESDGSVGHDASGSTWITRSDRHVQLINSSVYKADVSKSRIIGPSRVQRSRVKDFRARPGHSHRTYRASTPQTGHLKVTNPTQAPPSHTLTVEGILFSVMNNGKRLVRLSGDPNLVPRTAIISNVEFRKTKNGDLERIRPGTNEGLGLPCRFFSTTGTCPKGPQCHYLHDVGKVAICRAWLSQGQCPRASNCDLSHEPTPERVPTCVHYEKGSCTNPDCLYAHVDLAPDAQHCSSFGRYGYCDKGASCTEKHSFECPDYSNTGVCDFRDCKLVHRERASVLRRAAAAATAAEEEAPLDSAGVPSRRLADQVAGHRDINSDSEIDTGPTYRDVWNEFANQSDFISF